jgi:hypothetical protein
MSWRNLHAAFVPAQWRGPMINEGETLIHDQRAA